jgi:hypothetical protein
VSWEAVVARRPELVVIDAYRYDGQADVAGKQRALGAISALAGLPTVVVPLRCVLGGLCSLEGLARLRAAIGEARSRGAGAPAALPAGRGAMRPVGSTGEARSRGAGIPAALPVGQGAMRPVGPIGART